MTRKLFAGAGLGVLAQLSSIGLLLTSAWLIVRAAEHPPVLYLMVAIVSVRFFGLGRAVFRYAERLLTHDAALGTTVEERVRAYRELDRVAPYGLARQRRGDIVSRVVSDVDAVQDGLLRIRLPWVYALVSSACVITLLLLIAPVLGLVIGLHVVVCTAFVRLVVARNAHDRRLDAAGLQGRMSADASALVLSSRDLVASGAAVEVGSTMRTSFDALVATQRTGAWLGGVGAALVLASTGVTVAALALVSSGFAPALTGVVLLAPVALLETLLSLADAEQLRPGVAAARHRLDELAGVPSRVSSPPVPHTLPDSSTVVVRDLSIGWDRSIAQHISFTLDRGDLVGVSGPSGVGKSTLALTLARLIEPMAGGVELGGIDLADLTGADVRTRIGISGQDDALFDTTIRENLRVADPRAGDSDMTAALSRAGLAAFVNDLPLGLDTMIGERGGLLSGGERQRLGLARLILAGQDVLVFDEPTEHLDQRTADALMMDIRGLTEDHAVLVISHSPDVLRGCDRLVHLHDARPPQGVGDARGPAELAQVTR